MGFISGNAYLDLTLLIITLTLFLITVVVMVGCLVIEVDTFRRRKHYSDWSQK